MTGGIISYKGFNHPLKHAIGSSATGADREMLAASAGNKHVVIGLAATAGAGATTTLKSASTAISHVMALTEVQGGFAICEHGYWETASGEALNVNVSTGTLLWDLWYITVPV